MGVADKRVQVAAALNEPPDLSRPALAKVLVVDDDERNGFAAVQALEGLDCEVVVVTSGEEALRRLLTDEFAVILLDLHMPGMDGFETAALIRGRKKTTRTPIVFLTAIFRDEAHIFKAYSAGAVDMVFKPVDPFILRAKVAVFVDIYRRTEEARRLASHRQWLLEENARIQASKARAERALRRAEAHQQAILQSLPIVFHARTAQPPFAPVFVSESVELITGFPAERFTGDPEFGSSRIHPDDLDRVVEAVSAANRTGSYACEFRWRCADDSYRWLSDQGVLGPGDRDGEGQILGVIMDSTDRHLLEEQLAHAQKMEAVGQLTGGVAHDFNNLLTVVLGNIDILKRRPEDEARRAQRVDAIRLAAERGRDLTRQLLAFSRRQHLSPVATNVVELIEKFAPLIKQAVGEAVTVETQLDGTALWANVDVSQLEAALLNLAVNARDAMPEGGTLSIRASTATDVPDLPGEGVRIVLTDTGVGMDQSVRERVFEPFFTTKDVGRGSGLGLSQVYGFVRQSGGQIRIDSQPGQGTMVEIALPAAAAPPIEATDVSPISADVKGGAERILLVEDDLSVLRLTTDLLQGLGYTVVSASTAEEALCRLRSDGAIDLMFSDVVMPGGMTGITLSQIAEQEFPNLKILLTSGFIGQQGLREGAGHGLLDKPYDPSDLATRVRALLDAPKRRPTRRKKRAAA